MFFFAFNTINFQKCFCDILEKTQIIDPNLNVWSMKSLIPLTLIWTPFTDSSTPNPFTKPQCLPEDNDLQWFRWTTLGARRRSGSLILMWSAYNMLPSSGRATTCFGGAMDFLFLIFFPFFPTNETMVPKKKSFSILVLFFEREIY